MKLRWRFGLIAGVFLAVFSLYPQFKMIYLRGAEWNGHYAYNDIDEVAYAAYIKALIDGRPRKNDPYTGRDDSSENPQPESLFSIQFAAPYSIALPARALGIDAPLAMTIGGATAAFLTALAVFWLIGMLTEDSPFSLAGSLAVLAGGALFAGEGAIGEILDISYAYPYFPGFRRYIPAMAFPAFFALLCFVWKIVTRETNGTRIFTPSALFLSSVSILCFAYTVFSYFYVWTTAAAWLGCLGFIWLVARPEGWLKDIKKLIAIGVGWGISLVPYFYLLSNRSHTMDDVQMLIKTRALDLTRPPELIGFVVLAVIFAAISMKVLELRDKATLFAISLAATPALLFNQQLITGQQLQPIHYQVFIGNYVAGLALVVTLGLMWSRSGGLRGRAARTGVYAFAALAAAWGFVECHYTVRILDDVNVVRDEALPVARRLADLAKDDPTPHSSAVLHLAVAEADDFPTLAPQPVLWARHQHVYAGVTWQENKERYYQQLYYDGVKPEVLASRIKQGGDIVSLIALWGWGRHTDRLNSEYRPLLFTEVDEEVRRYDEYVRNFDAKRGDVVKLSYMIAPSAEPDVFFANIDKWYDRYDKEIFGKYALYKLRFR